MFGYIRPPEEALDAQDKEVYRAVYCSLCRELRGFGFGAKMFLNYDFVFAALLAMSQRDGETEPLPARCNTYPFKTVGEIYDPAITRCAAALIITCRHKLADDRDDERFGGSALARAAGLATARAYKRALALSGDFDDFLRGQLRLQAQLEAQRCPSFDRAADPTAEGLSFMLASLADERNRRIFSRLGYLIGRFVYIADAADDLEDDLRRGRYNPAIYAFDLSPESDDAALEGAREHMREILRGTAASAELCWRLADKRRFGSLLDAVIYRGLDGAVAALGTRQGQKRRARRRA